MFKKEMLKNPFVLTLVTVIVSFVSLVISRLASPTSYISLLNIITIPFFVGFLFSRYFDEKISQKLKSFTSIGLTSLWTFLAVLGTIIDAVLSPLSIFMLVMMTFVIFAVSFFFLGLGSAVHMKYFMRFKKKKSIKKSEKEMLKNPIMIALLTFLISIPLNVISKLLQLDSLGSFSVFFSPYIVGLIYTSKFHERIPKETKTRAALYVEIFVLVIALWYFSRNGYMKDLQSTLFIVGVIIVLSLIGFATSLWAYDKGSDLELKHQAKRAERKEKKK